MQDLPTFEATILGGPDSFTVEATDSVSQALTPGICGPFEFTV